MRCYREFKLDSGSVVCDVVESSNWIESQLAVCDVIESSSWIEGQLYVMLQRVQVG